MTEIAYGSEDVSLTDLFDGISLDINRVEWRRTDDGWKTAVNGRDLEVRNSNSGWYGLINGKRSDERADNPQDIMLGLLQDVAKPWRK